MKISKYISALFLLMVPFTSFTAGSHGERVFVHTDRHLYVAGENILFSFYLFPGQENESSETSNIGYLELINSNNTAVAQSRFSINKGCGHGALAVPDSLTTGVYMLRGYTRFMRNYGPEIFFTQYMAIYNPFKENIIPSKQDTLDSLGPVSEHMPQSKHISILEEIKNVFSPREKVSMKLRIDPSYFTNPDLCNISISVAVDEGSISGKNIVDLSEYMQEYPTVEGIQGKPAFYHENTGVYLEGSLIARETLQAVEGRTLYLSIPGKSIYLRYSDTGADGNFSFLIPPYRGSRDFIIQPADFRDDLIIKTGSPFAGMHEYDAGGKVVFNEELLDYASRLGVNYQVNKIYDISHSAADTLDYSHSEGYRFYGKPDIQVHLDDYIELPTMQEVFHELVPGVALRRQGGRTGFVFVTEPGAPTVKGPDAILLDGVIIDDPSFIAGLDPELIERIDVIRGEYQAGKLLFNGIVSIVSQEGDMCGIDYPNAGLRTSGTILDKEQRFINMIYSDSLEYDPSIPDFRNTLYWDPTVKPDDEGIIEFTFYTSDFLSEYSIIIQGLTDKNKAVSYHDQIDVTGN